MSNNECPSYFEVLENGLDAIDEALGYLLLIQTNPNGTGNRRHRKNTLLKLYAGIELVLKARLFRENWTYIFSDMNKADKTALKNGDLISVGGSKMEPRLMALCGVDIKKLEKECFSDLRNRRNKAEHFVVLANGESLISMANKNVSAVIGFIMEQFEQEVLDSMDGKPMDGIHEKLRQSTAHEDEVRTLAQKRLDALCLDEEEIHICPECLERFFVFGDNEDECLFCGLKINSGEFGVCEDCGEVFNRKETGFSICHDCAVARFDNDHMLPTPDEPED